MEKIGFETAFCAWKELFSEEKLAETMMTDGEFEIMNELFRRDLRDIKRQQMSHTQFVHDAAYAVFPHLAKIWSLMLFSADHFLTPRQRYRSPHCHRSGVRL